MVIHMVLICCSPNPDFVKYLCFLVLIDFMYPVVCTQKRTPCRNQLSPSTNVGPRDQTGLQDCRDDPYLLSLFHSPLPGYCPMCSLFCEVLVCVFFHSLVASACGNLCKCIVCLFLYERYTHSQIEISVLPVVYTMHMCIQLAELFTSFMYLRETTKILSVISILVLRQSSV